MPTSCDMLFPPKSLDPKTTRNSFTICTSNLCRKESLTGYSVNLTLPEPWEKLSKPLWTRTSSTERFYASMTQRDQVNQENDVSSESKRREAKEMAEDEDANE